MTGTNDATTEEKDGNQSCAEQQQQPHPPLKIKSFIKEEDQLNKKQIQQSDMHIVKEEKNGDDDLPVRLLPSFTDFADSSSATKLKNNSNTDSELELDSQKEFQFRSRIIPSSSIKEKELHQQLFLSLAATATTATTATTTSYYSDDLKHVSVLSPSNASPLLRQIQTPPPIVLPSPHSLSFKPTSSLGSANVLPDYYATPDFIPCTTPTSMHSPSASSTSLLLSPRTTTAPPVFDGLDTHSSLRGHVQQQLIDDLKPLKLHFDTEIRPLLDSWRSILLHTSLSFLKPSLDCDFEHQNPSTSNIPASDRVVAEFLAQFPSSPESEENNASSGCVLNTSASYSEISYFLLQVDKVVHALLKMDASLLSLTNVGHKTMLVLQHLTTHLKSMSFHFLDETEMLLTKAIYLWSPIARVGELLHGSAPASSSEDASLLPSSPLYSRGRSSSIRLSSQFSNSLSRSRSRPTRFSSPASRTSTTSSLYSETTAHSSDFYASSPSLLSTQPIFSSSSLSTDTTSRRVSEDDVSSSEPPSSQKSIPPITVIPSTPFPPSSSINAVEPGSTLPIREILTPPLTSTTGHTTPSITTTTTLPPTPPIEPTTSPSALHAPQKSQLSKSLSSLSPSNRKPTSSKSTSFFSLFKSIKAAFRGHSSSRPRSSLSSPPTFSSSSSSSSILSTTTTTTSSIISVPSSTPTPSTSSPPRGTSPSRQSFFSGTSSVTPSPSMSPTLLSAEKSAHVTPSPMTSEHRSGSASALLPTPSSMTSALTKVATPKRPFSASFSYSLPSSSTAVPDTHSTLPTHTTKPKVVCRLCEEPIDAGVFESHVKSCKVTQDLEMKLYQVDMKLRSVYRQLKKYRDLTSSPLTAGGLLFMEGGSSKTSGASHDRGMRGLAVAAHGGGGSASSSAAVAVASTPFHEDAGVVDVTVLKKYNALARYTQKMNALVGYERSFLDKEKKYRRKLLQKVSLAEPNATLSGYVKDVLALGQEKMKYLELYQHASLHGCLPTHPPTSLPASNLGGASKREDKVKKKPISLVHALLFGGQNMHPGHLDLLGVASSQRVRKRSLYLPQISDFEFLKPISKGAFGRVYLVRKKNTGDVFAMKMLKKDDMVRKNMVHHVLAERQVMSLANTPYVVNLYYAFQSPRHLFLVMDYLVGGDVSSLLSVMGAFPVPMAQHYLVEMTLALEYLHSLGIIHRDIKPDNVLIDHKGHLKLTDFGLSRILVRDQEFKLGASEVPLPQGTLNRKSLQRSTLEPSNSKKPGTRAFLGTPDYLAPELLLGVGHDASVDWWALGVCLFEFLCSYPPFTDDTPELIFKNILANRIDWPDSLELPEDAISLMKQLLNHEPQTRAKASDIKNHPFTKTMDWEHIRDIKAPFIPNPEDDLDTSYFDARNEAQQIDLQEVERETPGHSEKLFLETSPKQEEDQTFENFIFKNVAGLEHLNVSLDLP